MRRRKATRHAKRGHILKVATCRIVVGDKRSKAKRSKRRRHKR